jgi:hypothetical protein
VLFNRSPVTTWPLTTQAGHVALTNLELLMLLIGRWSPSKRSFRVRLFTRKRTITTAPREAQIQNAVVPDCRELSSASIALAND